MSKVYSTQFPKLEVEEIQGTEVVRIKILRDCAEVKPLAEQCSQTAFEQMQLKLGLSHGTVDHPLCIVKSTEHRDKKGLNHQKCSIPSPQN